jgi:[histone H3]-lysine36 N-dimethyltransferase SETMAR
MESEWMEQRTAIKFCVKLGKSASETHEMLLTAYGSQCVSRTTAFEWFRRFKSGRESVEDNPRCGRPATARTSRSVRLIEELLSEDRAVTVRLLEEVTDINRETIRLILREDLNKRKLCARFVPHSLNEDQKRQRLVASQDFIELVDKDKNFLKRIVTGDETWCFMYDPQTKRQSAAWLGPKSPKPQKVRIQKSKVKTMLIAFFDAKGLIHHEFVPEGQTITGNFYVKVMARLAGRMRRVRPQCHDWVLLHDNAPAHSSAVVSQFLAKRGVAVLPHPPYSPDLAPADYFLFPKIKAALKGKRFVDVLSIKSDVTGQLKAVPDQAFERSFTSLYERCKTCVTKLGDYIE